MSMFVLHEYLAFWMLYTGSSVLFSLLGLIIDENLALTFNADGLTFIVIFLEHIVEVKCGVENNLLKMLSIIDLS